jgi:hypothetical protein
MGVAKQGEAAGRKAKAAKPVEITEDVQEFYGMLDEVQDQMCELGLRAELLGEQRGKDSLEARAAQDILKAVRIFDRIVERASRYA